MQIEGIEVRKYRLFRSVEIKSLTPLSVFVGANGSGKSTLFDVFSFLKDSLTQNVAHAVGRRGGFKELASRGQEGPIEITIKFRETSGRLATYSLEIGSDDGRAVVHREVLKFRRGQYGQPWHFVDFSRGKGTAITNESAYGDAGVEAKREDYVLDEPSVLAIKGLGQFKEFRVVAEFRNLIENWYISDFHIAEARPSAEVGHAEHLSTRGDNVAQVAQYLFEHHRPHFDAILETMKRRVPGVESVEAKATEDGRLVLRFQDGAFHDPFVLGRGGDGRNRVFAYMVLVHQPKPPVPLLVELPETQLHPDLLAALIEEFRGYSRRGGQVLISTHSPEVVSAVKPGECHWLQRERGFSTVCKASRGGLVERLVGQGDSLGTLWRQGLLDAMSHGLA